MKPGMILVRTALEPLVGGGVLLRGVKLRRWTIA